MLKVLIERLGRQVGRYIGWQVYRLVGIQVGRLVGIQVGRLVGILGRQNIGRQVGRQVGRQIGKQVERQVYRQVGMQVCVKRNILRINLNKANEFEIFSSWRQFRQNRIYSFSGDSAIFVAKMASSHFTILPFS